MFPKDFGELRFYGLSFNRWLDSGFMRVFWPLTEIHQQSGDTFTSSPEYPVFSALVIPLKYLQFFSKKKVNILEIIYYVLRN